MRACAKCEKAYSNKEIECNKGLCDECKLKEELKKND